MAEAGLQTEMGYVVLEWDEREEKLDFIASSPERTEAEEAAAMGLTVDDRKVRFLIPATIFIRQG